VLPANPGGGGGESDPYTVISIVRTIRPNNDGTITPVVNATAQSSTYLVTFTFTMLAATWDTDGGPPLIEERTSWVDTVCAHPHVQGFHTEQDTGPDNVLYNYGVILVGTDDLQLTDEARVRMDQLNTPGAFAAIDACWKRLQAVGAT